ncbi:MAG: SAM-dependent methyltransferase [Terracidiphilus sp.]
MNAETSLTATQKLSAYRRLRHSLAQINYLRSSYRLARALGALIVHGGARSKTELDGEFLSGPDPWNYANDTAQHSRVHGELQMLDAVRGEDRFPKVLEMGCAEGIFTEQLALRCDSLLAVDISPIALERARERCRSHGNIRFLELDIRTGSPDGNYDLIVAIHSIEYLRSPVDIHRARASLVEWLCPGGFLLLGTMREVDAIEDSWWSRPLLRGGGRINAFFAQHPALRTVQKAEFRLNGDRISGDILFQKVER